MYCGISHLNYIIPSDNWEQQQFFRSTLKNKYYIIPSDNWEQQRLARPAFRMSNYIIPSDNWEQQLCLTINQHNAIISYQAITGNNNSVIKHPVLKEIISYQAITGNNN